MDMPPAGQQQQPQIQQVIPQQQQQQYGGQQPDVGQFFEGAAAGQVANMGMQYGQAMFQQHGAQAQQVASLPSPCNQISENSAVTQCPKVVL
jgi:hypothetical protein